MPRMVQTVTVFLVLAVLATVPCFASITGTVTDTNGDPVSGALVTFIDESDPDNRFTGSTDGSGQYAIDLGTTGVEEVVPQTFSLGQNYPNPFNPATTIPFVLDERSHVTLSIYNIMGQRVATIVDTEMGAGLHTLTWNGIDQSGNHVSAGVYLYRLRAGGHAETKKMLLLDGGGSPGWGRPLIHTSSRYSRQTTKSSLKRSFTVTISSAGIVPYERHGVVAGDGDVVDFVVEPLDGPGGVTIIEGITMVSIPGGSFRMGDVSGDGTWIELPVHDVRLTGFEMGMYEVTQAQYETLTGENPASVGGTDLPVGISWYGAVAFCTILSDIAGLERCYDEVTRACDFTKNGFRLPTEAEWEYACRAGTVTKFNNGDSESDLDRSAWYWDNWGENNRESNTVGLKEPNAWGLYDMHGNVSEWCNDWYDNYYYDASPAADPEGPASGNRRVIRGGSWGSVSDMCRSSYRGWAWPGDSGSSLGFRVVRRPGSGSTGTHTITGKVLYNGSGMPGVKVTTGGRSATTDAGGSYVFTEVFDGVYSLRFSLSGYLFSPMRADVTVSGGDVTVDAVMASEFHVDDGPVVIEGITMVPIPAGGFRMGELSGNGNSDQHPVHDASLSAFQVGMHEITQEQYESVMGENPSYFTGTDLPVEHVAWYDAVEFCNRLSDSAGFERCYDEDTWACDVTRNGFRLPTEAEWEYACRAGTETEFHTGASDEALSLAGWWMRNSDDSTHPVGQKEPNEWGLYDMHGNVKEWCNDWYDRDYYDVSPLIDPPGPLSGTFRVNRGGCWYDSPLDCRSCDRHWLGPAYRNFDIGFRVVRRP